jgi:NAD(P)-dependent dehydrogenase (short-subunit alcohol dehydrogenase family)
VAGRFLNKVALVTGAGSVASGWGNGKATAVVFARESAKIFAADIDFGAAEETCRIIAEEGGTAVPFQADVTKNASVRTMVAACLDSFDRIDILHNNVGGSVPGGPVDMPEEVFAQQIEFNLKSVFLTCKHAIPVMQRQAGGAIINVASLAAIRHTGHYHSAYEAAKAGLMHYTRTMAVEYAPMGIRANTVIPGHVLTPLVEHRLAKQYRGGNLETLIEERSKGISMGRMGDAWDVAYAALYLASDEAKNTTGIHIAVDGGVSAKCE